MLAKGETNLESLVRTRVIHVQMSLKLMTLYAKKDKKFAKNCQMTCDACKGGDKPGKPCKDKSDTCAKDLEADDTLCKKDKKFAKNCQMTCDACKGGDKPGKP